MTKYFTKYTIEQADSSSETAYVRDADAVHKEDFKHISPYVRLTTSDLMKDPGGDPLVPYIIQPWNTNTIRTKIPNNSEERLYNLDATIFKPGPGKKVTLQFVVYIPDNYTPNETDLKGTTIRGKDLHGFTVTDNNGKNSHYRVDEKDFGSFDVIDIDLYNLGTAEQHDSVTYDRAVIINVKATMGTDGNGDDALGVELFINNEDVSTINSLPWFIVSEAGTLDPTNALVQDNDKYSKSEIDVELLKKVDKTDYKAATGITVNDWKTKLGVFDPTITNVKKNQQLIYTGSSGWSNAFTYPTEFKEAGFTAEIGLFYMANNTQATDRDINLPNKANLNDGDTVYIMMTSASANGKTYIIKSDADQIWRGVTTSQSYTVPKTDWGQIWRFVYKKTSDYWEVKAIFNWATLPINTGSFTLNALTDTNISGAVSGQSLRLATQADGTKKWVNVQDTIYTDQSVNPAKIGTFYFLTPQSNNEELQLPDHTSLTHNDMFYVLASQYVSGTSYYFKIKVGSGAAASNNLVKLDADNKVSYNTNEYTMSTDDLGIVWRFQYHTGDKKWTMKAIFSWKTLPRTVNSLSNVTIDTKNIADGQALVWDDTDKKWKNQTVVGQKGDKGDRGPQGTTGPQGPQGVQGPQGPKGDKGDTGAKGDKGDKGDTGSAGATSLTGLTDTTIAASPRNGQVLQYDGSDWVNQFADNSVYDLLWADISAQVGKFYFLELDAGPADILLPDHNDLEDDDIIYILLSKSPSYIGPFNIKVGSGSATTNSISRVPSSGSSTSHNDEYTITDSDLGVVWRLRYSTTGKSWTMQSMFDWTSLPRTLDSLTDIATITPTGIEEYALKWDDRTKVYTPVQLSTRYATVTANNINASDWQTALGVVTSIFKLSDVKDVTPTSAEDGYSLVWDNSASKFELSNVTGTKGDKGDKGDTGPQGPKGDKGDTGSQGPQGPQGPAGATPSSSPITSKYEAPKEFFWIRKAGYSGPTSDAREAAGWFTARASGRGEIKKNTFTSADGVAMGSTNGKITGLPEGHYHLRITMDYLNIDGIQIFAKKGTTDIAPVTANRGANNRGDITGKIDLEFEFEVTASDALNDSNNTLAIEHVIDDNQQMRSGRGFGVDASGKRVKPAYDNNQPWATLRLVQLKPNVFEGNQGVGPQGPKGDKGDSGVADPDKLVVGVRITKNAVPSFASNTWQKMKLFGTGSEVFGMSTIDTSSDYLLGYKGTSITRKDDSTLTLKPGTYQIWMNTGRSGTHGHYIGYKATNSDISTTGRKYIYSAQASGSSVSFSERLIPGDIEILEIRGGSSSTNIEHTSTFTVSGGDSDFSMWFRGNSNGGNGGSLSIVKIG